MANTGTLNAFEASVAAPSADATDYSADTTAITADAVNAGDIAIFVGTVATAGVAGILAATEGADVASIHGDVVQPPVISTGGGYYRPPRRPPIEGIGYGTLPELEGEAHGSVVAASIGAAMLRNLAGDAAGAVGVGGHSEARFTVKAAASGARGSTGAAAAGLNLGAAGSGAVVARGAAGSAMIGNLEAAAVGQHDDDEAVIAWLMAA